MFSKSLSLLTKLNLLWQVTQGLRFLNNNEIIKMNFNI